MPDCWLLGFLQNSNFLTERKNRIFVTGVQMVLKANEAFFVRKHIGFWFQQISSNWETFTCRSYVMHFNAFNCLIRFEFKYIYKNSAHPNIFALNFIAVPCEKSERKKGGQRRAMTWSDIDEPLKRCQMLAINSCLKLKEKENIFLESVNRVTCPKCLNFWSQHSGSAVQTTD